MGRLEKIVVCTVLFLVAAILGISLSTDPEEGPQASGSKAAQADGGPQAAAAQAERRLARERALREQLEASNGAGAAPDAAAGANAPAGAPGGVMSTSLAQRGAGTPQTPTQPAAADAAGNAAPNPAPGVASNPASAAPVGGAAAPANGAVAPGAERPQAPQAQAEFLVNRAGLAPTASEEFMTYTWQAGDTFRALAQRFYGSPLHVKRLRDANEGRDEAKLAPGDTILVTVKPTAQADRLARPSARDAKAGQAGAGSVVGGTYTVGSGDVLGAISQKVYGTATKWRTIYDANRDVIGADPNKLKPGMVLRIPQ